MELIFTGILFIVLVGGFLTLPLIQLKRVTRVYKLNVPFLRNVKDFPEYLRVSGVSTNLDKAKKIAELKFLSSVKEGHHSKYNKISSDIEFVSVSVYEILKFKIKTKKWGI